MEEATMSEISQRFARLSDAFGAKVAAVPPERWSNPSPDAGWTARDVVRHMVANQGLFLGLIHEQPDEVPSVDDDPVGAWKGASAQVLHVLEDPQRADAEFDGFFGRSTFAEAVDRFVNFDLVVHTWDLSRATGIDERLDPDDVARVRKQAEGFGEMLRSPQVCGPAVEPPPGADAQTELLAFLGRRV